MTTYFGDEYKSERDVLQTASLKGESKLVTGLKAVIGEGGPESTHSAALDDLRTALAKAGESDGILHMADIEGATPPPAGKVKCAAAVKFLRHLYLVGTHGSQSVWVFSSPKAFTLYPQAEITGAGADSAKLKTLLGDTTEMFGTETKDRFAEVTQQGLSWCQKAETVLSSATTDDKSKEKVKRWFAEGTTTDATLTSTITTLLAGFKKMTNAFNKTVFVITDQPADRSNPAKELVEAYVLNPREKPHTIYIEKAFYENYDVSVLHDNKKNWTRVLVHEVSHNEANTKDNRYAFRGIGPGANLTAAQAAENADSWAFFAADCAGALTDGEITRATGGTGGTLTKLPKNWN